jgi:hypothetical protein
MYFVLGSLIRIPNVTIAITAAVRVTGKFAA